MPNCRFALVSASILLAFFSVSTYASWSETDNVACITYETPASIGIAFKLPSIQSTQVSLSGRDYIQLTVDREGVLIQPGMPELPSATRYVLLPSGCQAQMNMRQVHSQRIEFAAPLVPFETAALTHNQHNRHQGMALYPETPVSLSAPANIRGVRLAAITYYPLQFDPSSETYIQNQSVEAQIIFVPEPAPAPFPSVDLGQSNPEFQRYIYALLGRDSPQRDRPAQDYSSHYLVVSHAECLPFAIPLLEWKRRMGYKVEILTYDNRVNNPEAIKRDIQTLYDQYRQRNTQPFDYILILGDRAEQGDTVSWALPTFAGNPSMPEFPAHADYMYGLLEGDDFYLDAGVSRFGSGSRERMESAVARTLAYERHPYMQNTEWFTRAGVFSQNWGTWDYSIPYTTRWGERILTARGFQNILLQESTDIDDSDAGIIGSALARWFNLSPMSLMIGRAQNFYWNDELRGVNPMTVFPIMINYCGHGEFSFNTMFNSGSRDTLKGVVAATTGWGTPQTRFGNGTWLAMVQGLLARDLTLGWMRAFVGPTLSRMYPEYPVVLSMYQTDLDMYGDPGLKPWTAVPRRLRVEFPQSLPLGANLVEVLVLDAQSDMPVAHTQAALYYPGALPDPAEYADWSPRYQQVGWTDLQGRVSLPLNPDLAEGTLYLTITGRNLLPFEGEIDLGAQPVALSIESVELQGSAAAGSQVDVFLNIVNRGNQGAAQSVYARIIDTTDFLTLSADTLRFGDIPAGRTQRSLNSIRAAIALNHPNGFADGVTARIWSGNREWISLVRIPVSAPELSINRIQPSAVIPDSVSNINFELRNRGHLVTRRIIAQLSSRSWGLQVLSNQVQYDVIPAGEARLPINPDAFRIQPHPLAVPGMKIPLTLEVFDRAEGTLLWSIPVILQAGQVRPNSPYGPDEGGYICLDNTDARWELAPTYRWFEISPSEQDREGDGTRLQFPAWPRGSTAVVQLPFNMRFYGREYDRVTVCTNGFIAAGSQTRCINYESYPLDLALGGALGMIAPFWTNLEFINNPGNPGAYAYYDEARHRFIVEWYKVRYEGLNTEFRFQTFIYNPEFYPTVSGNSPVIFQYHTINLLRGEGDTAQVAVGISSPDGLTSLGYSYFGRSAAANPLPQNGRAILFTNNPQSVSARLIGLVMDLSGARLSAARVSGSVHGIGSIYQGVTLDNGQFELPSPSGWFTLTASKTGYNPERRRVYIVPDSNPYFEFSLSQPLINVWPVRFEEALQPGPRAERTFWLANPGNGVLIYRLRFIAGQSDSTIAWLRLSGGSEDTGSVAPDDSIIVNFRIQTGGLALGDHNARIMIFSDDAQISHSIPVHLNIDPNNRIDAPNTLPCEWRFEPAYPNPFNVQTTIAYSLKTTSDVHISIYDLNGREHLQIFRQQQNAGQYWTTLDLADLPPGMYICRMQAGTFRAATKLVLMK